MADFDFGQMIQSKLNDFKNSIAQNAQFAPGPATDNALQPLAQARQFFESPQPVQLPQVPQQIANIPVLGGVAQFGRGYLDTPFSGTANTLLDLAKLGIGAAQGNPNLLNYNNLKSYPARLGYNIGGAINPSLNKDYGIDNSPQQFIGNLAGTVLTPLSVYGGGKILGLGPEAAGSVAQQGVLNTIKQGAVSGAKVGGAYGALQGLADNRGSEVPQQLLGGAVGGVGGAIGGGITGGAISAGGALSGKAFNAVLDAVQKVLPNTTPEQQQTIAKQFVRDEAGRFAKGTPTSGKEPVYVGDLRESLGLPRSGNYQAGAAQLGPKSETQQLFESPEIRQAIDKFNQTSSPAVKNLFNQKLAQAQENGDYRGPLALIQSQLTPELRSRVNTTLLGADATGGAPTVQQVLANQQGGLNLGSKVEEPAFIKALKEDNDQTVNPTTVKLARPAQTNLEQPDLKTAAKNGLYAFFNSKQNVGQLGDTAAQVAVGALKTPQDQELFRQVIEHPTTLEDAQTKASNPQLFKQAVQQFRDFTDQAYKQYNNGSSNDQKIGYLKNYYSHILDLSDPADQEKFNEVVQAKLRNYKGWFSKDRVFADINELRDAGFNLKNQTVAQDIADYSRGVSKASAANAFINEIRQTHPSEIVTMTSKNDNVALPHGFVQLDPENKYGLSGTFVSRDLYKEVGNTLGPSSTLADNKLVHGFDIVNRLQKEVQLGLGGFHAFKTTIRQAVNDPRVIPTAFKNAFDPNARLAFRQQAIQDGTVDAAGKMGVTLGQSGDLLPESANILDKVTSSNPLEKFNKGLFGGLIDTYKINLVRGAMNKFDLNDPAQLNEARRYGAQINDLMGGLNYATLNRNKTVQQLARFAFLAPDFNEGKIRQVAAAANLKDWSASANFARYNVLGEAALIAALSEVGRKLTTGSFDGNFKDFVANAILNPSVPLPNTNTFNNPKNGKTQIAELPGSDISDVARLAQDPVHFVQARGSAGISTVAKLASGQDYYGNPLVDPFSGKDDNLLNRGVAIAKQTLPIPAVQGGKLVAGQVTPSDAALNTVGFRVKNNPDDPVVQEQTNYFNGIKQTADSLNPNDQKVFLGVIHPITKDQQGNSVIDKNQYTKPEQFATYLANPTVLNAERTFQQSQASHDPFWDWTPSQQKAYMQATVESQTNPGGDKTTTNALFNAIPKQLYDQRTAYFNDLQSQGKIQPQQPSPYKVQSSPEVSQFWQQYFALPQGSPQRKDLLQSPIGQQALSQSQQQSQLTNQQRLDMGLPLLGGNGSSNSSSGSSSSKRMPFALKAQFSRARKFSIKKAKPTRLKVVKPKLTAVRFANPGKQMGKLRA